MTMTTLQDCRALDAQDTLRALRGVDVLNGSLTATDFAADWFHPNDRGHRVWADAFWEAMARRPG